MYFTITTVIVCPTAAYASFLQSVCQTAAPAPPLLDSDSEGIEDALVGVGREAGGGGSQGHPSPSPPSLSLVDREPQSRGPEAGIQTKYVAIRAALKIVCCK